MKALVVDASNTMRSVLHRILSMRGFTVEEANDCQQAMDVLRGMGTADLVLVDWVPTQSGSLEFVSRLRQEQAGDTRVMMLVAAEPGARELHGRSSPARTITSSNPSLRCKWTKSWPR